MKKNYLTKTDLAKALSNLKGIKLADARSRVAKMGLTPIPYTIEVEGVEHDITYFETPKEYLKQVMSIYEVKNKEGVKLGLIELEKGTDETLVIERAVFLFQSRLINYIGDIEK